MKDTINDAYISNLSMYLHLLSNNEIIEEINKLKAYFNTKKIDGYINKKEKRLFKKAIYTLNQKQDAKQAKKCDIVMVSLISIYL